MKLDIGAVLREAWTVFKRDRDVLLPIAGLFLFLPQLAFLLLVPLPPPLPEVTGDIEMWQVAVDAWSLKAQIWSATYGLQTILIGLLMLYGPLALVAIYLDAGARSVKHALLTALRLLPRYLLASLLTGAVFGVGLRLLILPGLYFQARFFLVDPAIVGERPLSAIGAIGRSWRLTKPIWLPLFAITTGLLFAQIALSVPFLAMRDSLGGAAIRNPVSAVLVEGAVAAVLTAGALAAVLLRVAVYRGLAAPIKGI